MKKPNTKSHVLYDSICTECPDEADTEMESGLVVARTWGRGEWGVTTNGYRVPFWGVMIVFWN